MEILWQLLAGLCAGVFVAAGLFTFIASLGIVTRLAQVTRTADHIHKFESSFILGGIVGNLFWIYPISLNAGQAGLFVVCFFGGLFTGCLVGAVAEILNAFPIFFRRLSLRQGTALVIAALAAGKFAGVLVQYFVR